MSVALASTALLMGLAGGPHCVAMCGAACRAVACAGSGGAPPAQATAWLMTGRMLSYAAGGAVAAASAATLAQWSGNWPWLRPWWAMLHVAAVMLGLFLLWRGEQPRWMRAASAGVVEQVTTVAPPLTRRGGLAPAWQRLRRTLRPGALGLLWVAWPCGLLQSALLVAALSGGAAEGAVTMALFAAGSSLSLWAAPQLWGRLLAGHFAWVTQEGAVRLAGAALATASAWALWHALQRDLAPAFCA